MPFKIVNNPDPFYNEANQVYIMKSVNELKVGKGIMHELIEVVNDK